MTMNPADVYLELVMEVRQANIHSRRLVLFGNRMLELVFVIPCAILLRCSASGARAVILATASGKALDAAQQKIKRSNLDGTCRWLMSAIGPTRTHAQKFEKKRGDL